MLLNLDLHQIDMALAGWKMTHFMSMLFSNLVHIETEKSQLSVKILQEHNIYKLFQIT